MQQWLIKIWDRVQKHDILNLSATIAFTSALAIAPFVIILLSVSTFLSPGLEQGLNDQLVSLLGTQAAEAVRAIIEAAKRQIQFRGVSGAIGFAVLVVSASAIFSQLQTSFDKIDEVPSGERETGLARFIMRKFLSIGLVLGFVFLLIVSLFVTTALAVLFKEMGGRIWQAASLLVNVAVFSLLFSVMFRFIPSERRAWKKCFESGFIATVLFLSGKSLIAFYLAHSAVASAYGAAGSFVVLLVWLYYSAITLLVSYEAFTQT